MLKIPDLRLAIPREARGIAEMSRDCIEYGLSWSWTAPRVLRAMRDPATNVVVVLEKGSVAGFGIMQYGDDCAHLSLLAVRPTCRHRGLGEHLMRWLAQVAQAAGIGHIRLEARADNRSAIAFYEKLGFYRTGSVAGYYEGAVDAVQLEKRLG